MRTSGGRGAEGWIMAIPILAFIVAITMSGGGTHEMLRTIERAVRETITTAADFVARLF
jgi:hypothetical protein